MKTTLTESEAERLGDAYDVGPATVLKVVTRIVAAREAAARREAWDERGKARPQYLGPIDGHYDDCMGWEDCDCGTYPNPYRAEETP